MCATPPEPAEGKGSVLLYERVWQSFLLPESSPGIRPVSLAPPTEQAHRNPEGQARRPGVV